MTQVAQQNTQESAASLFWNDLMAKHPTIAGILAIVLEVVGFFLNGHFLVAAGRWVIRVSGYVAETALLFAVLWISGTSIAPSLIELFMSQAIMAHLVMVALITLALIPEIILANAIINAIKHWMEVVRDRRNVMAWIWAFLFTIPTIMFLVLTAITLNSLGSNGGNFVQASTDTLNFRMDAGWIYGLLEVVYAGVRKMAPHLAVSPQQNQTQITPAPIDYQQIVASLLPQLSIAIIEQVKAVYEPQMMVLTQQIEGLKLAKIEAETQENLTNNLLTNFGETLEKLTRNLEESRRETEENLLRISRESQEILKRKSEETIRETDPNLFSAISKETPKKLKEKVTRKLYESEVETQGKSYAITKQEAAAQLHCSVKDIEQSIRDGAIKEYGHNAEKVLISSLKNFVPSKRRLKIVNG